MKKIIFIFCVIFSLCFLFRGIFSDFVIEKDRDIASFNAIPVMKAGRVMPLSSAATDFLRMISGKSFVEIQSSKVGAVQFLIMLNSNSKSALSAKVFRCDNKEFQKLLGQEGSRYFSYDDISKNLGKIYECAKNIQSDKFSQDCTSILAKYEIFNMFRRTFAYYDFDNFAPLKYRKDWRESVETASKEFVESKKFGRPIDESKLVEANGFLNMLKGESDMQEHYKDSLIRVYFNDKKPYTPADILLERSPIEKLEKDYALFSSYLESLSKNDLNSANSIKKDLISSLNNNCGFRVWFENFINRLDLFTSSFILFVLAFISIMLGFVFGKIKPYLYSAAFALFASACVFCVFAVLARCYIQMRPPVTNIYSSVVFTGAFASFSALMIYIFKRKIMYMLVGVLLGALSSLVALNLPYSGDTMAMMVAVLNSNFWLTTHVMTIMIGYCAIFLAGTIAALRLIANAILRGKVSPLETLEYANSVYAILCFGLLFSFIGTMLGGIWADMSWGRFWGWDPKENGALIIVLWTASCIHCKLFNIISNRAFLALAVLGNVVVVWAWFGVNMLGIGLHAYGFFNGKWFWFILFVLSQALISLLFLVKEKIQISK